MNRALGLLSFIVLLGLACKSASAAPGDLLVTFQGPDSPAPYPRAAGDEFGVSVAPMGNNVLIGADQHNRSGSHPGVAYLYDGSIPITPPVVRSNPLRTLPDDPVIALSNGDHFGDSVGAVGNNIVVGAGQEFNGGSGFAYLTTVGKIPETPPIVLPPQPGDWFGYSVAPVGNNFVVGAQYADAGGAAYLFDGAPGAGDWLRTIQKPGHVAGDRFGTSVAGLGNNVLVGAVGDATSGTKAGAAYLFDSSNGNLMQTFLPPPGTAELNEFFGFRVAGAGNKVIVGAPYKDAGATDAGAAYVFDASTGALLDTILNPTPAANEVFGYSVAANGNYFLIGARLDMVGGIAAGAVYLYDASGTQLLRIPNPNPHNGDVFGESVAFLGNNILVGASSGDTTSGDTTVADSGVAYLFQGVPEPSTLVLLGAGAVSLLAYAWRRWRRAGS